MRPTAAVCFAVLVALPLAFGSAGTAVAQTGPVDCSYPVSATDATGTNVTVAEEPERIVVLGPSTAQTVWEIGAQDGVVGMPVNAFTAYLDGREGKTNVVNENGQPVNEQVLATEPDLVLAPNIIQNESVETLREALPDDVPVYRFAGAESMEDVAAKTELTGRLVGEFDAAAQSAAETRGVVSAIAEATADRERPTVYYAMGGGFTAGTETFIGELIDAAGGRNVAAAANITGYAAISQEVIADEDPDWIVVNRGMSVPANPAVNESTAIQEGNVLEVDPNYLNQPGPRTVIPLEQMAEAFHPDAVTGDTVANAETPEPTQCVGDVTPTPTTPDETTTTTSTTTDGTTTATTTESTTATTETDATTSATTDGSGAGFGVVATLVALVAALALATRRR
jgi:iron complex transport system substrate-binding protein